MTQRPGVRSRTSVSSPALPDVGRGEEPVLLTRALGLVGAVGAALFLGVLTVLHVLRPDLGAVTAFVSDYANGRYGGLFTAALLVHGLGNVALAVSLALRLGPSRVGRLGSVLLGTAALGIVAAAVFPTDPVGAARTSTGAIHGAVASAAFPVEVLGLVLLASAFAAAGQRLAAYLTRGTALLAALALGWLVVAMARQSMAGAPERVVLVSLTLWELSAAAWLSRRQRRHSEATGATGQFPPQVLLGPDLSHRAGGRGPRAPR